MAYFSWCYDRYGAVPTYRIGISSVYSS